MLMLVRNGPEGPSHIIAFRSGRLSRWVVTTACCAVTNFVAVQVLLIGRFSGLVRPQLAAGPFAALYLVIGCALALLTFGMLLQWAPLSETSLPDRKLAFVTVALLQTGAVAIVSALFVPQTDAALFIPYLLLAGGVLIVIGTLLAIAGIGPALLRTRPPLPGGLMLSGFVFLFLALVPGLISLLPAVIDDPAAWLAPLSGGGMKFFAAAGLGGWLVLSAIGAGYRLLPTFMPAPAGRSGVSKAVFCLCVAGAALAMIASVASLYLPGAELTVMMALAPAIVVIGVVLYLAEISHTRIYGAHARQQSGATTSSQWPHRPPHQSAR